MTRRDFLAMAALAPIGPALLSRRWLNATAVGPSGGVEDVLIVRFSNDGKRLGAERVPKIVKAESDWKKQLSPLAFEVTRHADTERSFSGAYWNLHEKGIFRCVCCDTALFTSANKFDSGTGWPSFWQPIARENVVGPKKVSRTGDETEATCRRCDAHLGDIFDDGPPPTGIRYCIDSVSLRFVKAE
jgi:peptide-methionine (R)-S-oxide reductase